MVCKVTSPSPLGPSCSNELNKYFKISVTISIFSLFLNVHSINFLNNIKMEFVVNELLNSSIVQDVVSSGVNIAEDGVSNVVDNVTSILGDTGGLSFLDNNVNVDNVHQEAGPAEIRPQVEPGSGGEMISESSKEVNTITTVDSTSCHTQKFSTTNSVHTEASTSEKLHEFEFIGRWINLEVLNVGAKTAYGQILATYDVPKDLLTKVTCATNLSPFESFANVIPNVEMQFTVNGLRTMVGKVIVFFILDAYDRPPLASTDWPLAFVYPHVELDLCSRNSGVLNIGYNYFESMLEIHARRGKVTANFGKVIVMAVGVNSGTSKISNVQVVVKYRFVNTKFAGITTRKEVTTVNQIPPHPNEPERNVPEINTSSYSVMQTYPATRFDFSSGGSGTNLVHQMRLNPNKLTINKLNLETSKDTIQSICREWGPIGSFTWKSGQDSQTTLYEMMVDPARLCYNSVGELLQNVYSPLVYMSNMFQFWRGPIEIRLKFISNEFITGEAMVSVCFGRDIVSSSYCQANSGYSKYIILGKDREFTFTIPYIHVNPWKRTRLLPRYMNFIIKNDLHNYYDGAARDVVWEYNQVYFRINVVSPLQSPDTSPSDIRCIVEARAAKGFDLAVPCMQNCRINHPWPSPLEAYPRYNFNAHMKPEDTRTVNTGIPEINNSITEPIDITEDFSSGKKINIMTSENHNSIISIMQRPIMVIRDIEIVNNKQGTLPKDSKCFYHPVTPNIEIYKGQDFFNVTAQLSPQFALLNTHRYWRGSMRFIFEFTKIDSNIVVIQFLPNSGIVKVGEYFLWDQTNTQGNDYYDNSSFCGNGLAELRVDLTKQRIITIEVPFYRESNWCRTVFLSPRSTGANTTDSDDATWWPNDIASYVAGHVCVWSEGDNESIAKYRVYVAPGDDFKLAGYVTGLPVPYPIVGNEDLLVVTDDQPTRVRNINTVKTKNKQKCSCSNTCQVNEIAKQFENLSLDTPDLPEISDAEEAQYVSSIKDVMLKIHCTNMAKLPHIPVPKEYIKAKAYIIKNKIDVFNYSKNIPRGIISSTVNNIGNFVKNHPIATAMGVTAAASPVLGIGAAVAAAAGTSSDLATTTQNAIEEITENVTTSTTLVNENISILSRSLGTTVEIVKNNIEAVSSFTKTTMDKTTDMFEKLYDQLRNIITPMTQKLSDFFNVEIDVSDFFFDFVNLILNCNYKTFALIICKFLVKFKILTMSAVSSLSNYIQNYVKKIFLKPENKPISFENLPEANFTLQSEEVSAEDKDFYSTVCGIFIGIVSAGVSVSLSPTKYDTLGFIKGVVSTSCTAGFWSIVRSASAIMKNLIGCMINCYKWITRKLFKDADYAIAFEDKAKFIEEFCNEAQEYCRVINSRSVTTIPSKKKKFLEILLKAMYIKTLIVKSENKSLIKNVPTLLNLCNNVIKTFDDYTPVMRTGIVGYNSFVICMKGEPGLGKSFVTDEIITACLKEAKIPMMQPDLIYYENNLNQYSSGYTDQPAIVDDDWCSVKSDQPLVKSLAMLISLASPAPYRPVQAELSEKKNLANPPIYYLNCNDAFPHIEPIVTTPEAIWRRRNILCTITRTSPIPVLEEGAEIDRSYPGLTFQFHKDGKTQEPEGPLYNFEQARDKIAKEFASYNTAEKIRIKHRFSILMECIPHGNDQIFLDPFSVLHEYNAIEQLDNGETLPLDKVCSNVRDIVMQLDSLPVINSDQNVPEINAFSISSISKSIITKIIKKTYTQVFGISETYFNCSICMSKNRFIFVKCSNGTDQNTHGICYQCYEKICHEHRRNNDNSSRVPPCVFCKTGTYIHSVDKNVEHYICKLIGDAFEYLEMDGSEKIKKFHMLHASQDWLWNMLGAVFWLSTMSTLPEDPHDRSPANFPLAMCALFGYFTEVYMFMKNMVVSFFDAPEIDENLYPNIEISTPVNGDLMLVSLRESIICKHQACNKNTAENFMIMQGKHGEIVVINGFTYDCISGADIIPVVFNVGDEIPLEYCSLNCPFSKKTNVVSFIKHIIKSDVTFEYKLNRSLADPQSNVPRWLCGVQDNSDYIDEIARIALVSKQELQTLHKNPWYMRVYNFVTENWKKILLGIGVVSTCVLAYCNWSACITGLMSFCSSNNSDVPEVKYDGVNIPTRMNIQRIALPHRIGNTPEINASLNDVVELKVVRNTVFIKFGTTLVRAVGVTGRLALIPKHYILFFEAYLMKEKDECTITNWNGSIKRVLRLTSLVADTSFSGDIAILTMPVEIPQFANIIKYMPTEAKASTGIVRNRASMIRVLQEPALMIRVQELELRGIQKCKYEGIYAQLSLNDCLFYDFHGAGECGHLILQEDGQHPLIAMHVGGNQGRKYGFGELLYQELFLDIIKARPELSAELSPGFIEKLQPLENSKIWFPDEVEINYMGTIPPEMVPYMPKKTKLRPSLVSPMLTEFVDVMDPPIPNRHQPAILTKEDPRWHNDMSPLVHATSFYGKVTKQPDLNALKIAESWIRSWIFDSVKPLRKNTRPLTIEEAIIGVPELPHYDGLDLSTSAGWPFNQVKGKTKKSDWIEVERNSQNEIVSVKVHPKVLSVIEHQDKQCLNNIMPVDVFENHLKDEKRIKLTKTRAFCMAPINASIRCARDFIDFKAAFTEARLEAGHAIGINVNSYEWNDLYNMMMEHNNGNNIMCMDYENFGPGFNAYIGECAWNIILDWLDLHFPDVNVSTYRRMTAEQFKNCIHLVVNLIIQQVCGAASGGGLTTYINSLTNLIHIAYSYIINCINHKRIDLLNYADFRENKIVTYGDDLLISVSEKCKQIWNQQTFQSSLKEIDINVTDAFKSANLPEFYNINEVNFLKRGFKIVTYRNKEIVLPPLAIESVESCPHWIKDDINLKEATYVNCEVAVRLAADHGIEYFEGYKANINQCLVANGIKTVPLSWNEIMDNYYFNAN